MVVAIGLAGEGIFEGAARLDAAFAGKPAPTQMRTHIIQQTAPNL
jgi:hypothetical protein